MEEPPSELLADVALACHIDVLQAAVLLPKNAEGLAIFSFTPDITDTVLVSSLPRSRISTNEYLTLRQRHVSRPFNGAEPFYESPDAIDVALYSDAIIALYPYKSKEVLEAIIVPALEIYRSYASKLVVVRAVIGLTVEYKKSPAELAYICMKPLYEGCVGRILSIHSVSHTIIFEVFRR